MKNIIPFLESKAYNMRYWSVVASSHAGSGHPTTCLSAADIMSVLFFYVMKYDPHNYENPNSDRFILSKGHASALLYAAWHEVGIISDDEILTYRRIDSVLEGHPTLRFGYTEAATGSLGIGLSIGVGEALCAKLDKYSYRTYVLLGDSETSEGSVWEAVQLAVHYKLDNLVAIIDCNRLGQSTESMLDHHMEQYKTIFSAFGWKTFVVDGHNITDLIMIFDKIKDIVGQPIMILARTIKGYGIDFAADKEGFHGKAFTGKQLEQALADLKNNFSAAAVFDEKNYFWQPQLPKLSNNAKNRSEKKKIVLPRLQRYEDDKIATRKAYGHALSVLGDVCQDVVCLDAEVKNSTYAEIFEENHQDRFFQCFIAEQNMLGMGIGLNRRGKIPFISTFSSFFSRAHDQIRMAAIGNAALRLVGSHCGVSIGQDGPSQMGLEDIAMMRCLPESIVLYPCDAVSTYKLVEQMANYNFGISYLRTTRMDTQRLYDNDEQFPIGGCKVLRQSDADVICIIAAGVTLFEALKAYDQLVQQGIHVSIIDVYSIKPLDVMTITSVAQSSCNKIVTVEDHYPEGGIGEAVAAAVAYTDIRVERLAVSRLPRSGKPEELLAFESIDAAAIIECIKKT